MTISSFIIALLRRAWRCYRLYDAYDRLSFPAAIESLAGQAGLPRATQYTG